MHARQPAHDMTTPEVHRAFAPDTLRAVGGASLPLSAAQRHKLAGVERADPLVWDAHKLMMMPALVTAVLFKDGVAGAAAFAQLARVGELAREHAPSPDGR